jgi:hypothetical protein
MTASIFLWDGGAKTKGHRDCDGLEDIYFYAFSLRELVSTSLENALTSEHRSGAAMRVLCLTNCRLVNASVKRDFARLYNAQDGG